MIREIEGLTSETPVPGRELLSKLSGYIVLDPNGV
jgi:hypothetical protein